MLSGDAEEFLSYLAVERGRSANTVASYRRDLVAYEEFLRARALFSLEAVSPSVVEDYLAFLLARPLARSSVARAQAAIRGLHRFCQEERAATSDPTSDVERVRPPRGLPKPLTEAEVERLLAAPVGAEPRSVRDRAILELLYGSGLRISELSGLSLGDLDLAGGLVRVLGKGSKERIVPVGRLASAALSKWLGPPGRGAKVAPGRLGGRPPPRDGRGARREGDAARAAPLVRDAPSRPRRGHPRRPGAARARVDHDDPDLHRRVERAPEKRLPGGAPPRAFEDPRRVARPGREMTAEGPVSR